MWEVTKLRTAKFQPQKINSIKLFISRLPCPFQSYSFTSSHILPPHLLHFHSCLSLLSMSRYIELLIQLCPLPFPFLCSALLFKSSKYFTIWYWVKVLTTDTSLKFEAPSLPKSKTGPWLFFLLHLPSWKNTVLGVRLRAICHKPSSFQENNNHVGSHINYLQQI